MGISFSKGDQIAVTGSKVEQDASDLKQWIGKGGDSLRFGFASLWITDYRKGLLCRIPESQLLSGD
jgi:hypothetical protein